MPAATSLRRVVSEHEQETRAWDAAQQARIFKTAVASVQDDAKVAGSLALAIRRHKPKAPVAFVIHKIELSAELLGRDIGFLAPSRECCVIWGDIRKSQPTYDGLVKALIQT